MRLRENNIEKLQDRLLFVEWEDNVDSSVSDSIILEEGMTIPITRIKVPDFREVFAALGARQRAIPAKIGCAMQSIQSTSQ